MPAQSCYNYYCPEYRNRCSWKKQRKPCRHPTHQVPWFSDLVNVITARVRKRQHDNAIARIVCPHCGRTWEGANRDLEHYGPGVIQASHITACKTRTPHKRRQNNTSREWYWEHRPLTRFKIWNDPDHHGLIGARKQ